MQSVGTYNCKNIITKHFDARHQPENNGQTKIVLDTEIQWQMSQDAVPIFNRGFPRI
jgi:hypothetical protein